MAVYTEYVKKPVKVVAALFDDPAFPPSGVQLDEAEHRFYVITIHGQKTWVEPGDYIVLEPCQAGEVQRHYPVKKEIFEARHDYVRKL